MDDTLLNNSNAARPTILRYLESRSAAALTAFVPQTRRSGSANVILLGDQGSSEHRAGQPMPTDYVADRLFDAYDHKIKERDAALWSRNVIALCADRGHVSDGLVDLSDDVASVSTSDNARSVFDYAAYCDGATGLALLNIDLMDDLRDTVPRLLSLRKTNPELPIVILSSGFAASDLTTERARIADASVRLPTTASGLRAACRAAILNTNERLQL